MTQCCWGKVSPFSLCCPHNSPTFSPSVYHSGAYVCKGRSGWLMPLGEALWENPELQLCIPVKFKRAPPLPPPPGPAMCSLLLDMLASDPDTRPTADQLESRVCSALKEDPEWLSLLEKPEWDFSPTGCKQNWTLLTKVVLIDVRLLPYICIFYTYTKTVCL